MKKIIRLMILILIILIPNATFAEDVKSIIVLVDELPITRIEELSLDKYGLGLINLKTRLPYSEEGLFLSINTGKKLSLKEYGKKNSKLEYLGDLLEKEKTSYIGEGRENLLIGNKEGKVDYEESSIEYNFDWLVENTDALLNKSNLLLIAYDFQDDSDRITILGRYLENYKDNQIIVLPKKVAVEDKYLLNKYLVPLIYIDGQNEGLLTSLSTNRDGFVVIEDISVQLKNTYGYTKKIDIGKPFKIIEVDKPIDYIGSIYKTTMNLLIIAYIFHGFIYLAQVLLGIWILKSSEVKEWLYITYAFVSTIICISIILGLFQIHKNIFLYLIITLAISYLITRFIINRKFDLIKILSISTFGLIVTGTFLYPEMIYNSYIGFNNLVYGARYFGLNNGIMGVLLVTSILSYFNLVKSIESINLKRFIGLFIFILNMATLSTSFGANTGGFITSIALFGIILWMLFSSNKLSIKRIFLFFSVGMFLFAINMIFDNNMGEKSHAIRFFYRLKENGVGELISMASFKLKELLTLTLLPPFSIVLGFQIITLKKLVKSFKDNEEMKKEAMIVIITSLIGFILNDTGVITFIYMIHYLILDVISHRRNME